MRTVEFAVESQEEEDLFEKSDVEAATEGAGRR